MSLGTDLVPGPYQEIVPQVQRAIDRLDVGPTGAITPMQYGAIADGTSHPLSTVYATLAAAQVDYPFATALTQEIDYCAVKQASNVCFGADGSEHGDTNAGLNKPLYLPGGTYVFGADTWLIRNGSGLIIYGTGRRSTILTSNTTVFATDGLWYSEIHSIGFKKLTTTSAPCVDIDGNVPGHPYATRSVQGNNFSNLLIDGGGGTIGSAVCRLGYSSAQGENSWFECHWSNATTTYWQRGFNALANIIIRGDMQVFTTGVYLEGGSINIYGMSFESTKGYAQITDTSWVAQGGFDIDCSATGVSEPIVIQGCRTESLRFFRGSSAQTGVLSANNQAVSGASGWNASTAYTTGQFVIKTVTIGGRSVSKMYRVTTAGTSAGTEPTWPTSGTVTDNTVVWTLTDFYVVDVSSSGQVYLAANHFVLGDYRVGERLDAFRPKQVEITANYTATLDEEVLLVDSTAGNVMVTLPAPDFTAKHYYIKKYTTDANTVSVQAHDTSFIDGDFASSTIPGGSRGWMIVASAGGGSLTRRWWVVSRSFAVGAPTDATYITQTSNSSLSNEQALSALATGIVKNTTGTGVLSIAQDSGWTTGTGTANKGAFATYAGQTVSATYVQAEAQATDDAVKANSQRIKALEDALRALLLIN